MVEEIPGVEVDCHELGLVVLGLHPDWHAAVRQGRGPDLEDLLFDLGKLDLEMTGNIFDEKWFSFDGKKRMYS